MDSTLRTEDGRQVLRIRRLLPHAPEKVWRAVTEPAHLAGWFPATVTMTPRIGETITFASDGGAVDGDGVITEFDEPRVFAFTWNNEALRIELLPADGGCELLFTHTFDDRVSAGSFAAGWHACLDALAAGLDGTPAPGMTAEIYAERHEEYHARYGLLRGTAEPGGTVRIERLYPYHDGVWGRLTEGDTPKPGDTPPLRLTNGYVPAGPVTVVDDAEGDTLAYESGAGEVRWQVRPVMQGTRVTITQTQAPGPAAALAAWHTQLEMFASHLRGQDICPWPDDRTEELRRQYAEVLAAGTG